MTMMMSELPLELLEEILSRVVATSLKRLRLTCKLWNALIKDKEFGEKQFLKAAKESLVLLLKEYRVSSVSVKLKVDPPIEFKGPLNLEGFHSKLQVDIVEIFHCDGLLLCITKDNRLVVWNPCLGETWWIQHKSAGYTSYTSYAGFALGYVNRPTGRSYKILRCWNCDKTRDQDVRSEIYEFSSDSWRVLNDEDVNLHCHLRPNGASLKGRAYWHAYADEETHEFLLRFDFTKDRFKRLCLPRFQTGGMISLSLVREEQLSVLHQSFYTQKMDIWVTNAIDNEDALTWSKSFIVDIPINPLLSFVSFLVDEETKVALFCNRRLKPSLNMVYIIGEDNKYNREIPYLEYTNESWWRDQKGQSINKPFVFSYVPSLVQLQQGKGNRK